MFFWVNARARVLRTFFFFVFLQGFGERPWGFCSVFRGSLGSPEWENPLPEFSRKEIFSDLRTRSL